MKNSYLVGVLVFVTFLCVGGIAFTRGLAPEPAVVRITRDGTIMNEIPLESNSLPRRVEITNDSGSENVVLIEPGRVCMEHANCPDEVCVHQGWISDGTVPIVCLPHRIVVEILGETGGELDGVVG